MSLSKNSTEDLSHIELPGTDEEEEKEMTSNVQNSEDEDEIHVFRRRSQVFNRTNVFGDSDDESDNEEVVKRRETLYREHPEGDDDVIEDNVYSKATRKSIYGFLPVKELVDPEGNESDEEIIILDSDDDEEQESYSKLSSTMYSPKTESSASLINKSDIKKNESNVSELSSDASLSKKNESSVKDDSVATNDDSDLSANNEKLVSQSFYNEALKERQAIEEKLVSISKAKSLQNNLPDAGKKLNEITAKLLAE